MEEGYGGLSARVEGALCSRASDGGERNEHGGWKEGGRGLEALEETKGVFSSRWNGRTFLPLLEHAAT